MKVISRKEAEEAFQALSPGCDNKVNPTELCAYLKSQGVIVGDDDEEGNKKLIEMFADIDANNDHQITLDEFINEICKEPRKVALEEAFRNIDKDGSGKIDHAECIEGGKKAGLTDAETLEACWNAMDSDGSGKVDMVEFLDYMTENY